MSVTTLKTLSRDAMAARGVHSHRRYSGEGDIAAACGQLAAVAASPAS